MKRILTFLLLFALLLCGCAAAEGADAVLEVNTQVKHYLLLGQDGYDSQITEDARTDTIVVVSLDKKYNRVIMTSILRDSKINNPNANPTKANMPSVSTAKMIRAKMSQPPRYFLEKIQLIR